MHINILMCYNPGNLACFIYMCVGNVGNGNVRNHFLPEKAMIREHSRDEPCRTFFFLTPRTLVVQK